MEERKWCVYLHTVHADCGYDKYYVGITSKSAKYRWGKDGNGYSHQLFGKVINKYGWDNIIHEVLHVNVTEDEAKKLERKYIDIYNSYNRNYGYNLTLGGDGSVGWHPSEETRQKISESLSGEKHPWYGKHHTEEYKIRMRELNTGRKMKPKDKEKLSNRKKYDIKIGKIKPPMLNKKHSVESKNKMSKNRVGKNMGADNVRSKAVYQYSLNGNLIGSFPSLCEAERVVGIDHRAISACCLNRRNSAGGYMWSYDKVDKMQPYKVNKNPGKSVNQYKTDETYVNTFNNIHEAHIATGANEQNISGCCRGTRKTCGGYIWRYAS